MNRWDNDAIDCTNLDAIKAALIGRTITRTVRSGEGYGAELAFTLDDGSVLTAHATDGGCACSNGCYSVAAPETASGTILNVEVGETSEDYMDVIRVFVYDDLGKHTLIESEGTDNGFYGYGFWLDVEAPK